MATGSKPFDAGRALVFAIGIGVPVAAGLALSGPSMALLAGVGALNALFTDPRRRAGARLVSIAAAMLALLVVAFVGSRVTGNPRVVAVLAVALAFPAGFVPPAYPYLAVIGKLMPLTMLAVGSGLFRSDHVLAGVIGGMLFATLVTMTEAELRRIEPYADPMHELTGLFHGNRNDVGYAVAFAAATALSIVAAHLVSAPHPLWATVAAVFVMHPEQGTALQQIGRRVAGTLAGVALAWPLVVVVADPWLLVGLAVIVAALVPGAIDRGVLPGTIASTVFVLILFDLGLLSQGGDRPLIVARFGDTLLGAGVAALCSVAYHRWHRARAAPGGGE